MSHFNKGHDELKPGIQATKGKPPATHSGEAVSDVLFVQGFFSVVVVVVVDVPAFWPSGVYSLVVVVVLDVLVLACFWQLPSIRARANSGVTVRSFFMALLSEKPHPVDEMNGPSS